MTGDEPLTADEVAAHMSDERMTGWGHSLGIDLTDRNQLLDAASVGLTVSLWRNTVLEHIHGNGERGWEDAPEEQVAADRAAEGALLDGPDRSLLRSLDGVGDTAELPRIEALLTLRRDVGCGIPDDVMMRVNCSTVRQVRAVLNEAVGIEFAEPGAHIEFDRSALPPFLGETIALLDDPNRLLTVGAATFPVVDLFLANAWGMYLDELYDEKPKRALVYADLLGQRRALWMVALSGASYGSSWFPNRPWPTAVDRLRALAEQDEGAATIRPDGLHLGAHRTNGFWETLASEPERLNGRQAIWVMLSEMTKLMWAVQDEHRAAFPAPVEQFNPFMALI